MHKKYVDLLNAALRRVCVHSLSLLCSERRVEAASRRIKKIVYI
jgi:hypothetical protein